MKWSAWGLPAPTAISLFSFIHSIDKYVSSARDGQDIVLGLGDDSE